VRRQGTASATGKIEGASDVRGGGGGAAARHVTPSAIAQLQIKPHTPNFIKGNYYVYPIFVCRSPLSSARFFHNCIPFGHALLVPPSLSPFPPPPRASPRPSVRRTRIWRSALRGVRQWIWRRPGPRRAPSAWIRCSAAAGAGPSRSCNAATSST
jgi:hypothetical protein